MKKLNNWDLMISGKLYNASSRDISKQHKRGLLLCEKFNKTSIRRSKAKQRILEKLIPSAKGNNLGIFSPFYCEYGKNIKVGKECFVNYNSVFLDVCTITLGNNVLIGANVVLATPNHPIVAEERICNNYPDGYHNLEYSSPITIEDNCWICSSVTICGGVTVGKNSVIAAGSVVTKDVPPNSLVKGVPAKVIRKIDADDYIDIWNTYINEEIPLSKRKVKENEKSEN